MDKKRTADAEPDEPENLPPAKHPRPNSPPERPNSNSPNPNPSTHANTNDTINNNNNNNTYNNSSPPSDDKNADNPAASDAPPDPDNDPLVKFQRAQLAARIREQQRDIQWLRDKVDELHKFIAALDAAPAAALYHMCAVREDLTLTLSRLGASADLDPSECPIAATLLDAEIVTNKTLAEVPAALKKLTSQIILAVESSDSLPPQDTERRTAHAELHRRIRQVSDQLERYEERAKQSLVSSTTCRDEYEDLREESSLQRRKIVSLENKLGDKQREINDLSSKLDDDRSRDDPKLGSDVSKNGGGRTGRSTSTQNGKLQHHLDSIKELAENRLKELQSMHSENKRLISEAEKLRGELARRDSNVVPIKTILGTALYQTMEATLQQLYLKEKTWIMEREAQSEELDSERKDATERLEQANATAEKTIEDLRHQLDEMRRIADAAKVEKDKVVMTYEARKMEAGNAAPVIAAAEKRASVSDEMREKLTKSNKTLTDEVAQLRSRVAELENDVKNRETPDTQRLIEQLRKEVESERGKSGVFIQEVESVLGMFSDVEAENKKLVKMLAEKEQVLSKVMAERLRGRQLLTTVREENRALTQGREIDSEKIKSLTAAVAATKKMAQEATAACNKGQEEARALASTLEKRRRIADDASVTARAATAEKDEMKRERDAFKERAEQVILEHRDDKFESRRLREKLSESQTRLEEVEDALQRSKMENGQSSEDDSIRDEIIRELRRKVNCSIVTSQPKEVVLLRCGHLFSRQCTDNLIATRNRKCPICGKPFGNDDVRSIFF